ncbi:MAG: type II toxin-antitoxin system VapC family toxin [Limnothrix sp. CACIAM 69d]|nr:MAG: type II toxin-antitoxin system VapC family toxin [Limnothrix sp. CACIAM 69d]
MLLDTHALLWFLEDSPKLPSEIKERIENSSQVVVSIASIWEIAIKLSINKLKLQFEFRELPAILEELEISILPLSFEDTNIYLSLPLHHRDPFDRILIAQAINHSLSIASADIAFDAYATIRRLWG